MPLPATALESFDHSDIAHSRHEHPGADQSLVQVYHDAGKGTPRPQPCGHRSNQTPVIMYPLRRSAKRQPGEVWSSAVVAARNADAQPTHDGAPGGTGAQIPIPHYPSHRKIGWYGESAYISNGQIATRTDRP
ncbi:hypothetical protein GGTG_05849 [Gaeumannomyces tritici R3-111a-1]|uniref:Uncharacterized protein n=1 Tax=Gaeumannomyces tritici (strain R3-111a-1) TaxID=644352 RepID=J3NX42_GAET3|nr:hypothetical protein GGTG_05849 [Gaeumannomyces tritici R3-111a-1]EJT75924.1 hypothetical protein GGTG_05849 [Gaeumannomyces tritici R3-111a-1]